MIYYEKGEKESIHISIMANKYADSDISAKGSCRFTNKIRRFCGDGVYSVSCVCVWWVLWAYVWTSSNLRLWVSQVLVVFIQWLLSSMCRKTWHIWSFVLCVDILFVLCDGDQDTKMFECIPLKPCTQLSRCVLVHNNTVYTRVFHYLVLAVVVPEKSVEVQHT